MMTALEPFQVHNPPDYPPRHLSSPPCWLICGHPAGVPLARLPNSPVVPLLVYPWYPRW